MKSKLILLLFYLICFTNISYSQSTIKNRGIKFSYFNEQIARPGLQLGYEVPAWHKTKAKKNEKTTILELIVKTNLGFFTHSRNNTSLFLNCTIGYRYTSKRGLMLDPFHIGVGYIHSFLGEKTYTVDNNGTVVQSKLASNAGAMLPYVSLIGLGYDFRKKQKKSYSISFSVDGFLQYPVNTQSKLRLSIPVNFIYYIK